MFNCYMATVCEFVKEVKYLGVMIHSLMKTTIDVTRHTCKFYFRAIRTFRHCSDQVKCVLFQTYCIQFILLSIVANFY